MTTKSPESGTAHDPEIEIRGAERLTKDEVEAKRVVVQKGIKKTDTEIQSARDKIATEFPQSKNRKKLKKDRAAAKEEHKRLWDRNKDRAEAQRSISDMNQLKILKPTIKRLKGEIKDNRLTEEDKNAIARAKDGVEDLVRPWRWQLRWDNALRDYAVVLDALEITDTESSESVGILENLLDGYLARAGVAEELVVAEQDIVAAERKIDEALEEENEEAAEAAEERLNAIREPYDELVERNKELGDSTEAPKELADALLKRASMRKRLPELEMEIATAEELRDAAQKTKGKKKGEKDEEEVEQEKETHLKISMMEDRRDDLVEREQELSASIEELQEKISKEQRV